MFRSLRQMTGYAVHSQDDEEVGVVSNFLFDDLRWIVRYMVLDSRQFLKRKRVLLSPIVFGTPDRERAVFPVQLDSNQIASSPDVGEVDPVTRRQESEIHEFYHWPAYWEEPHEVPPVEEGMVGWAVTELMTDVEGKRQEQTGGEKPRLRDFEEATRYTIYSRDGENAGELYDLIVHEQNWRILYMVVSTGGILPGRKVLLSPASIVNYDWENSRLELNLTRDTVHNGQEYDPDIPLDRTMDENLYRDDQSRQNP
jgi:sporulation protein YlmC with PRC-barrel domain